MKLFKPTFVALIKINDISYEYYGNELNQLSLVEEQPTFKLNPELQQLDNYPIPHTVEILSLFSTKIKIPRESFINPIKFITNNKEISIDQFYIKGGEASIYTGKINNNPVIFKMYTRAGKKLRALSPKIRKYQPYKYILFKEGRGRYLVGMQILQEAVWSEKIFNQSLEFLKIMDDLNEIHGDISPGNLMMDYERNVKFIDFIRIKGGTPFYSKNTTDRQALGRTLLGIKYTSLIKQYINQLNITYTKYTLFKLYDIYLKYYPDSEEKDFFNWFYQNFPQDEYSLQLLQMAI